MPTMTDEHGNEVERELTPQELAMKAIHEKRRNEIADQIVEAGGQKPEFEAEPSVVDDDDRRSNPPAPAPVAGAPKPVEPPVEDVDDVAAQLAKQTQKFAGDPATTMVDVVVDGETMTLPLSTVLANAQKTATADRRLREATTLLADAKKEPPAAAAPPPAAAVSAPAKTDIKKLATHIFEGDEDGFSAGLEDVIAERVRDGVAEALKAVPKGEAPDAAAITASVKEQITWETTLTESQAQHPWLYSDPDIEAVAKRKLDALTAEGVSRSDALKQVQTALAPKFAPKAEDLTRVTPINKDVLDRAGKKKGIETLPAASARLAAAEDAPVEMDASARAARGIAQLREMRPNQTAA